MPINWDGTTAADVQTYIGPTPPANAAVTGQGSFIDNFVSFSDAIAGWLAHGLQVDDFVTAADYAGAAAMHSPEIPAEIAAAGGEAITAAGDAAANAAKNTVLTIAPYALAAGLVWIAIESRRAR